MDASSIILIDRFFESSDGVTAGDDTLDRILHGMLELARDGRLCFPVQVRDECRTPRVKPFADEAYRECSDLQPGYDTIREVMAVAGEVVAMNDESDIADPWVLAQALEQRNDGHDVWVVTEDRRDRLPKKLSLTTAARKLDLSVCRVFYMIREEGLWP